MANTKAIARLEGQLDHLVTEFNKIEEDELQSQQIVRGQHMIDEDASSNSYHKHVQATSTRGSKEIFDETISELSLEDPEVECFTQDGDDLNIVLLKLST